MVLLSQGTKLIRENMKFTDLDLNDDILDALYDMRFDDCTPVQEKCIPEIIKGKDVLGVAQTGTGKTAAYLLPVLSQLADGGYSKDSINCLIMSPTRELAQQIDQAMQGFSYYIPDVSSVAVYGGNDGNRYDQELKSMRLGADVIIATPGRLISHLSLGNVDLSKVSFFILDEADRMLDMGFSEDIMKIASYLPKDCQTIMFSATMPQDIEKLAQSLLKDPVEIKLAVSKPAEKIQQSAYICYETQKLEIIKDIFKAGNLKRVIIFSGSKQKVKRINQALTRLHINSGEMHSDLDQAQRDQMMFKFKSGQLDVLVATDILARGIDIDDITMVINYDVPHDCEDYVHRIGRTARADRDGQAITLVNEDDMFAFHQVEKFLDKEITKNALPEECGEGPEYVVSKRKASAKSNRRKDRDNTSHKSNKQRNKRNTREEKTAKDEQRNNRSDKKPRNNEAKTEKPSANDKTPQKGQQKTEETQKSADNRDHNEADNSQKQNRRRRNSPKKDNAQTSANVSTDTNAEPMKNGNKQRHRKPKRRRPQEAEVPKHGRTTRYNGLPADFKAPQEQESSLKKLFKRPLSWIKNIGKK
jgi:ATP-dependent RNA helicase RhlE